MRGLCTALLLLTAALAATLKPSTGRADVEPEQYRVLIAAALEEYDLGHFQEALSLFVKAHELVPSARTLRGMGLASYQARKYVIAVGYLRAALEDTRKPLTPQFRQEVKAALDSSQSFVATFSLDLRPPDAKLTIDGEPFVAAGSEQIMLDPGDHELVASAPGYQTASRHVSATAGRRGQIVLQLSRLPLAAAGEAVRPAPPPSILAAEPSRADAPSAANRALAIGGMSLAVVGGALGLGAGLKARSLRDELDTRCAAKECPSSEAGTLADAKTWANLSTASLAVGGAGLAAGIVGIVLWTRQARRAGARTAQLAARVLGTNVAVSGTF